MQAIMAPRPGLKQDAKVVTQIAAIQALDFEMIKRKLMLPPDEGKSFTQEQADEAEKWYKRYLTLMVLRPDHVHVPNGPIDAFWHQHILDTQRYGADCEQCLGFFLHHYPYFGLNGPDDAQNRDRAFDQTNAFYREIWGEDCTALEFFPKTGVCGQNCNGGGSGTGCGQGCSGKGK
ncbi:hypothetical protein EPO17_01820 [Patescibacteria group bacterium]|nr:MAG: hypothetical protein EPO17_01820 [Patescibacteria group bacterium]